VPEEVRAISAFFNTAAWDETRDVLEREQTLLLTDRADELLSAALEQDRQNHDPESQKLAAYTEAHLKLLRRAREVGIPAAWEEFKAKHIASEE
jgi:uncharacterized protein (DUF1778 family)